MNTLILSLMGLILGYLVGIALASVVAFVFGFEEAARFVAIGCGLIGALLGPLIGARWQGFQ